MFRYILYFFIAGVVVSGSAYIGSRGKGSIAAFISCLPAVTVLTMIFLYKEAHNNVIISYAKSLIWMCIPWIFYILVFLFLLKKLGFWLSLGCGILTFIATALIILKLIP